MSFTPADSTVKRSHFWMITTNVLPTDLFLQLVYKTILVFYNGWYSEIEPN